MEKNKYSKNLNKYEQLYFLIEDYAKEYSKFLEDKDNRTNENRCERYYKKVYDFVKQELDRTREEVITEIYNFVEGESGRSGRKEILEFISKLTTK